MASRDQCTRAFTRNHLPRDALVVVMRPAWLRTFSALRKVPNAVRDESRDRIRSSRVLLSCMASCIARALAFLSSFFFLRLAVTRCILAVRETASQSFFSARAVFCSASISLFRAAERSAAARLRSARVPCSGRSWRACQAAGPERLHLLCHTILAMSIVR